MPIAKISTADMSREEWLEERRKTIGGSDAAAILGLNEWHSAYSIWAEKTGKLIPEDISDKESVRLGNDLEQYVAERFAEATGKKVRRENHIIYNSDYPFAHANPDRMIVGENAGLECKTTTSYEIASQLAAGDIPKQWYCQCVHYMMVTGAKRWYLAALVFGRGFYWQEIVRDDAEIEALAAAERDFFRLVESGEPPAIDGSQSTAEAVDGIYTVSDPGVSADLTPVSVAVDMYLEATRQIASYEQIKRENETVIKDYMQSAERGTVGDVKVSWKSLTRKTFDRAAYEADHGEIPVAEDGKEAKADA